jgi:hypothetical protein
MERNGKGKLWIKAKVDDPVKDRINIQSVILAKAGIQLF